jgi:CRP-like cAMP-binding protein
MMRFTGRIMTTFGISASNGPAQHPPPLPSDVTGSVERSIVVDAQSDIFGSSARPYLHVLQTGWACTYQLLPNGQRQIVAFHLPGAVLDLDRIMTERLNFSALALSECTVGLLPLEWVRTAIDTRPAIRDLFWTLTTLENRALLESVVNLGRRTARERLAYLLSDLLERLQAIGEALDGSFTPAINQSEMADALGLSQVHLNRSIQRLKTEGLVAIRGRRYEICDAKRLRQVAKKAG